MELCPVVALRTMLKYLGNLSKEVPLFQVKTRTGLGFLTAPKVRSFLKLIVRAIGLNPARSILSEKMVCPLHLITMLNKIQ